ncbi:uncharacterized protein LOC129807812 isoform X2 [Phlebotomus papatasi]|uniref:uncharacterized protein LOC129807812 isoform X2 n=1 Tax=Phlebotomus papatasi TaxID=29031 RepID=UPI002484610F|nr:uncharacterized protein LOC129807812 isoform X2 [Phlebotomus papatasi]
MESTQSRIPRINGLSGRTGLPVSVLGHGKVGGGKGTSFLATTTSKLGKFAPNLLRGGAPGSRLRPGVLNLGGSGAGKGLQGTFEVPKSCSNENISCKRGPGLTMAEEDCEMLVDETISLVGSTDHLALQDDELELDETISRTRGGLTPEDCDKGLPLGDRTQIFHSTFDVSHHHSRPPMNSTPNAEEAPHLTFNVSKMGDQVGGENPLQLTYVMSEGGGAKVSTENLLEGTEKKPSSDGRNFTKPTNLLMLSPKDPDKTLVEATEEPPELSGKSATPKPRFSFGLDLTDCTLDCSIELCDISLASSGKATKSPITSLHKQNSFEMDESLGILTPDQMKEFLDSNNLELPLAQNSLNSLTGDHKVSMHQCRVDQTPSPEELPLDPVAVKTDTALVMSNPQQIAGNQYQEVSQTDSDPKTDQMTKSVASKVSVSFITSVTSITSLDTGYQGDGEMSRPASRGADHSPSNGPRAKAPPVQAFNAAPVPRRQDPMTDSDFFTESDADDIFHHQRGGDRRAQVIDGQLYGPSMQAANVYIHQPQQGDDSCMESSGIFTDVDNRAEDDFTHRCAENDMSPDGSTDTLQSNGTECSQKKGSASQSPASLPSQPSQQLLNPSPAGVNASAKTVEEKATDDATAIAEVRGAQKSANSGDMDSDKSTIATQRSVKKVSPNRKHVKSEMGSAGKVREVRRANTVGGMRSAHDSDMENQENKVPQKKIKPPNKWDGVMNKIAEGKTTGKTKLNISDVKSKVFCGLSRGSSKISATGSSTEQNSPKRLTIAAKRGRTYSKDSQQSSQSDLSVSGGGCSPKLQPKSSILSRTAKKRDVRTITASPSDLGPPNKTTGNNANVRNARVNNNAPQKRSPTITVQQSLPATVPDANKGSPPAKRMVQRRQQISSQPPTQAKLPLKDHNRLAGVVPLATKNIPGSINHQKVASGVRQQQQSPGVVTKNGSIVAPIAENGFTGSHQTLVKTPKTNGVLPERLTQCRDLAHANRGFEALGVVIQYLVHSLDAFSMPTLKQNHERTTRKLLEARLALDETRTMCQELEVRLMEQEGREVQLREDHLSEKEQMESRLMEVETRFRSFVAESNELRATKESELKEAKLRETDLMQRVSDLSTTENALRDKVVASEAEFGEKLRLAAMRERELQEKTIQLQRQLDETKAKGEMRERELEEKVNLLQDELSVLRHARATNGPTPTSPTTRQRTTSSSGNHNQVLQDEVESLRCVLELKQSEISDLRKHNQELQRAADEQLATMVKLSAAESRVEDLEVQLGAKINEEKELLAKNKTLQESYIREQNNCSRLVLHNEELQWKLKHNSEKFSRTITELSKSYHEARCLSNSSTPQAAAPLLTPTRRQSDRPRTNGGDARLMESFEMDDVSPPTSPVMKGIVEKSDSVSWVLEMEDESAEALASRVVRRAGSFRAQSTEKTPGTLKRTKGAAALSQSASAASILHQQPQDSPRNRSQSMSLRASGRNLARSNSVQTPSCSSRVVEWREPNFTSSPLPGKSPPAKDGGGGGSGRGGGKKRANLITCDTSALTPRSERARLQLPTHSSVHDLQNLQPKESAGEAMVSGSNSEDEASSVDSSSAASSSCGEESSSNSASPTNRRLRLGDFVMNKIVASLKDNEGATPMEVTWSEDGEQYPSESIV